MSMSRSLLAGVAGSLVVAHATGSIARAQSASASAGTRLAAVQPITASRALTFSVKYDNVALEDAVQDVARRGQVELTYVSSVLPRIARVSYEARDVSAVEALRGMLTGFPVRVVVLEDEKINLMRDESKLVQAQGTISGKVVNAKTKQPIAGATVMLDDATRGVLTGVDGLFRLPAPVGDHVVHIRAVGMVRQSPRVTVKEGETAVVEVMLEPSASVLNEVIVTGTVVATERKAIPTPITVIKAEDIEKRGITRIEQLFRGEVPGLLATDRGSQIYSSTKYDGTTAFGGLVTANVYSRGSSSLSGDPNPIKTYIDGVELLDPSYLGTIDPKSIERIEIITGPQAATIYGSGALGGVMQIFTKKGGGRSTPDVTLSLKYGAMQTNVSGGKTPVHNHALMMSGGTGPAFSYSGDATYNYQGQWQPSLFSRLYSGSLGAVHTHGNMNVSGSFSITKGRNGTFDGAFGSTPYWDDKLATGEWNVNGPYGVKGQKTQIISLSSGQTFGLNVDYRLFSIWQHHLTVGKSQNSFDLVPTEPGFISPVDSMYKYQSAIGERVSTSYNMTLSPDKIGPLQTTLTVGMNGSNGSQTSYSGNGLTKAASSLQSSTVNKLLDSKSWGGFGSLRVGVFDQLYLTLGVRAERNSAYGSAHTIDWTPTNGLTYTIERGNLTLKLLGSYGRATRAPIPSQRDQALSSFYSGYTPAQYIAQLAAPTLTPEYERGPQGGLELYYGNLGSLTINRYQQTVTDLIQSLVVDSIPRAYLDNPPSGYWYQYQYQNVAKVRKHGWELTSSVNLGPLMLRGVYSWNDSRVLESRTTSYYKGQSFQYVPTHTGNVTVGYAHGGTSVTIVNNYLGARPVDSNTIPWVWDVYMGRLKMYAVHKQSWPIYFGQRGYMKSDLAMSQRLSSSATLTLNMLNLANSFGSEVWILYPTIGRQTTLGLSLKMP